LTALPLNAPKKTASPACNHDTKQGQTLRLVAARKDSDFVQPQSSLCASLDQIVKGCDFLPFPSSRYAPGFTGKSAIRIRLWH
jgi:hypothetical protein